MKKTVSFGLFLAMGFIWCPSMRHSGRYDDEKIWMASLSDPKEAMLFKQSKVSARRGRRKSDSFDLGKIIAYIEREKPDTPQETVTELAQWIHALAKEYRFHPALILSLVRVESRFQTWAVSTNGAIGLMQLMPETGRWLADRLGVHWDGPATLLDPETNLRFGVHYLAYLREKYNGNPKNFLAAYNVGPKRIDDWELAGRPHSLEYYRLVKESLPVSR